MDISLKPAGSQDEMEEDEETQQSSVDNYTGVAIKVGIAVIIYSVR